MPPCWRLHCLLRLRKRQSRFRASLQQLPPALSRSHRHDSQANRLRRPRQQRHPDSPRQVPELLRRRRDNRQHRMDNHCPDSTGNRFHQCRAPRRRLPSRHRSRENHLNPDRWQRHPDSPRQVPELLRRRRDNRQHRMDNHCPDSTGNRFHQCRAPRRRLLSRHRSRELHPQRRTGGNAIRTAHAKSGAAATPPGQSSTPHGQPLPANHQRRHRPLTQ